MYYKLYRIFLGVGLIVNSAAIFLRYQMPLPDFWIGFSEGCSIALLLGSLHFLSLARKAGEAQADCDLCKIKRSLLQKLRRQGGTRR